MAFNRKLASEVCDKLKAGVDEEVIAAYHRLSLQELYNLVDYENYEISRQYLKHFCASFLNNVCLSWPNYDEHLCPSCGYEMDCPLKK